MTCIIPLQEDLSIFVRLSAVVDVLEPEEEACCAYAECALERVMAAQKPRLLDPALEPVIGLR